MGRSQDRSVNQQGSDARRRNDPEAESQGSTAQFLTGLARAFGGALLFSLPVLMTMEMWFLGFYADPARLGIFMASALPLLLGLSRLSGFRETFDLREDAADALVALSVGFVASAVGLFLLGVLEPGMAPREVVGKIAIQVVPASIGALLAQSQLGQSQPDEERRKQEVGYYGELFLMVVGALFLALAIAPTEEVSLIAYRLTEWQAILLMGASLAVMHAFVYALEFRGGSPIPPDTPEWLVFLRFTVVGYALVLLTSTYALWVFGQIDGQAPDLILMASVVLGLPGAVGAAAARLIL